MAATYRSRELRSARSARERQVKRERVRNRVTGGLILAALAGAVWILTSART